MSKSQPDAHFEGSASENKNSDQHGYGVIAAGRGNKK